MKDIGPKINSAIPHPGHMTKMAAMAIHDKNFKNLYLPNQKAEDLETWYLSLAIRVLSRFCKWWPCFDLDLFEDKDEFSSLGF